MITSTGEGVVVFIILGLLVWFITAVAINSRKNSKK